jgi:Gpi18-like mannosyltransferase
MRSSTRNAGDWQTVAICVAAGLLLLIQAPMLMRDVRTVTNDTSCCFLPWYDQVLAEGRFRSLQANFANYPPPTIYLFSLVSFLQGTLSEPALLKLVNVPFIIASGWLAFRISQSLGASRNRAVAVGLLLMVVPEVWENALRWGQFDIIYTCFLLAFYRLIIAKKPVPALIMVGTAFAFKLQTVFVGPLLLALLLTGELSLWHFALIPVTYLLWMIPAALAGRPWSQLFVVYVGLSGLMEKLSMSAPNPYFMIQNYIPYSLSRMVDKGATLSAVAASLLFVWAYCRRPKIQNPVGMLTALILCLLFVPYLLPRMHERYFFAADVFAVLWLAVRPRMWFATLLLQLTAFLTYRQYFMTNGFNLTRRGFVLPVLFLTIAIGLTVNQFGREGAGPVECESTLAEEANL